MLVFWLLCVVLYGFVGLYGDLYVLCYTYILYIIYYIILTIQTIHTIQYLTCNAIQHGFFCVE
jgi:hypothetical protein